MHEVSSHPPPPSSAKLGLAHGSLLTSYHLFDLSHSTHPIFTRMRLS